VFTVANGLGGRLRQIIEDRSIGNLASDVGSLAPVRGDRPGRPADTGQRTDGRCLLRSAYSAQS
jgi:hypothetical protein